jgi:DNA invertase Pin-like site-specific DNA recombinase
MLIGYARVSTSSQSLDLQISALEKIGCQKIFTDISSGAKTDRPGLNDADLILRGGDTLVVWKLDRLGRSIKHLIETVNSLEDRGIEFKSLQESIDTGTSGGKLIFHMFSALAEFERDLIRERTSAGLKAARSRGKKGGRPKKVTSNTLKMVKQMHTDTSYEISDICKTFNISKSTLYRYLNEPDKN